MVYKKKDGVFGPVSADELQNLIEKGRITLDQEASQNEKGPWEPLKSYDLFQERPHPIEEMFESNDESTPDGNPETVPLGDSMIAPTNQKESKRKQQKCERFIFLSAIIILQAE